MTDAPTNLLPALTDLPVDGFGVVATVPGARSFQAASVRKWVLQRGVTSFDAMTDLSKGLRAELAARYRIRGTKLALARDSEDGTKKLLIELADGNTIESVLIPEAERTTLCMSTQVGCGVRCAFCASGLNGVVRNLTAGEMVEQFLWAREVLAHDGRELTNIVVMGGGEPLNNFEHLAAALETINHADGIGFGARRITVSTIGIPAKIDRLEELGKQVNLAISLHAPNEALRGRLIPGFEHVALAEVLAAARRYFERTGREITFEYVVLKDVNDRPEHARELVRLLRGMRGKVNLIPWNPVGDLPFQKPEREAVDTFAMILDEGGIKSTVRRPRGRDIDAACGQLRRRYPTGEALRGVESGQRPARS